MIRNYQKGDESAVLRLWNAAGAAWGYASQTARGLETLLLGHRDFSPRFTFVLVEYGQIHGFISGCTGDHIPKGDVRGYLTCLLLSRGADNEVNTRKLLAALEWAFREAGRSFCAVTFFNPIRLPWILPGTRGRQHNNAPGIPTDLPLHERMLACGYRECARECAMYLDLESYQEPGWLEEKAQVMEERGYTVAKYDPKVHSGLEEMLDALGNPLWRQEIPAAAEAGMEVLVGLKDSTCAGFTGPIYPEETGRGYFAGLGVAPSYEGQGLGTLLFHRLLQRQWEKGAAYMSLFTGETNHAKQIYLDAGFRVVRTFGVMLKEL